MYSMTGYGRGAVSMDGRELTIELKSVNNRFLDIGMKLPRQLSFLEDGFRKLLSDGLRRGHVVEKGVAFSDGAIVDPPQEDALYDAFRP
jgi:uncharacterized protein (TIGR00255 family)